MSIVLTCEVRAMRGAVMPGRREGFERADGRELESIFSANAPTLHPVIDFVECECRPLRSRCTHNSWRELTGIHIQVDLVAGADNIVPVDECVSKRKPQVRGP